MKDPKPTAGSSVDPSGADFDDLPASAESTGAAADLDAADTPEPAPADASTDGASTDDAGPRGDQTDDGAPGVDRTDGDAPGVDPRTAADLALFLPGGEIALGQARDVMGRGKRADKARLLSLLLTYAGWDEIWAVTHEDEVRKLFSHLDLPPSLAAAWAR
ncbi:MAG: hypothetical protein AAGF23_20865, partial [Acidobacteriota bacterium]